MSRVLLMLRFSDFIIQQNHSHPKEEREASLRKHGRSGLPEQLQHPPTGTSIPCVVGSTSSRGQAVRVTTPEENEGVRRLSDLLKDLWGEGGSCSRVLCLTTSQLPVTRTQPGHQQCRDLVWRYFCSFNQSSVQPVISCPLGSLGKSVGVSLA